MTRPRYEVQFKDGSGAWRRWSATNDRDRAKRSLRRLEERIGGPEHALRALTRIRDSKELAA